MQRVCLRLFLRMPPLAEISCIAILTVRTWALCSRRRSLGAALCVAMIALIVTSSVSVGLAIPELSCEYTQHPDRLSCLFTIRNRCRDTTRLSSCRVRDRKKQQLGWHWLRVHPCVRNRFVAPLVQREQQLTAIRPSSSGCNVNQRFVALYGI